MTLRQIGEEKLLAQILPTLGRDKRVIIPAGDDCATARFRAARELLVLKSDCVVEGVHFKPSASAVAVGWKAMMRALSDFAAISAVPEFALIALVISGRRKVGWVRDLYRGLARAAARFDVAIVGGETSDTPGNTALTVSVSGYVERDRCVARSGGKAGDDLFVTGTLGGSIRRRHLNFVPRIAEARWLTRHFPIHAMIDLSDGMGVDLPRLAKASKLAFTIEESALPLARGCTVEQAISDGEDYELLFAVPSRKRERLLKNWKKKFPKLPLTRVGKLIPHSGPSRTGTSHIPRFPSGYVHFKRRR